MVILWLGLLLISSANVTLAAVAGVRMQSRDSTPKLPYDEKTISECTWWHDQTTTVSCDTILSTNAIDIDQFRRWNPSIGAGCAGLTTGRSYCVEAAFETLPTTTSSSRPSPTTTSSSRPSPTAPSTTTTATPSPTVPSNGIETPLPSQPGMVSNCDAFYFVQSGEGCADIAQKHGITLAQFLQWNSNAGSNCGGLWAEAYACVSIIGHTPTKSTPTPTKTPNGIQTPLPTQPGMVDNCDDFYFVKSGENCATIASAKGITLDQFRQWNPQAGNTCGGLWAEAYACVSVVGHTPTPTQPSNGITTPTPIQSGMVTNCNKFHFVASGETCPVIQSKYRVTLSNLVKWNPAIKSDCTGMWGSTYLCVGVIS